MLKLARLVCCAVFVCMLVPACSLVPVQREAVSPPEVAAPVRTVDAAAAERLVAAWTALGMKAEAVYVQMPAYPTDRIEWKSLNVVLSQDPVQMEGVMASVGQFAARGARPVVIHLYARNRKQDTLLSQALKKGAVQSGGRNSVKLEHHIHPDFPVRVQLLSKEGAE